jgi:predicted RNA-binding Zn-ribbon protein involved in translation (DUF1610 family)
VVDTMTHIPCRCGSKQEEVLNYETRTRVGWYCPKCGEFTRAIGRERKLEGDNNEKEQNTRRT